MTTTFIDCEALTISYNVMGIATINYTIVGQEASPSIASNLTAGGVNFSGVIMNVTTQPIPNTEKATGGTWYTTNVTLVAVS